MGAGKDFVADQHDFFKVGFADPMYDIAEFFFGTSDKSKPGIRKFLQNIGQWGRGHYEPAKTATFVDVNGKSHEIVINDDYEFNARRAVFCDLIRQEGNRIVSSSEYRDVDWSMFGFTENFWVDVLLKRVDAFRILGHEKIAVTNVRFPNELEALYRYGFTHFHVMCSHSTRVQRLGDGYIPSRDGDISERMAHHLDKLALVGPSILHIYDLDVPEEVLLRIYDGTGVVWNDNNLDDNPKAREFVKVKHVNGLIPERPPLPGFSVSR